MRARTSREVPEWSGGEELYIGSQVSATGKVSGVTGIVPGPPEGSRGSTGWGHLSRRAPWAESGREPALSGLGRPLGPPPLRLGLGTLGGSSPLPWGARQPLPPFGRRPPWRSHLPGPAPPQGAYIKVGGGRAATYGLGRLPPPLQHLSLSRRSSAKPCRRPATSTTTPSCCWISINLSFPLAGSRKEETSLHRTCVERGGAVRSALGHR